MLQNNFYISKLFYVQEEKCKSKQDGLIDLLVHANSVEGLSMRVDFTAQHAAQSKESEIVFALREGNVLYFGTPLTAKMWFPEIFQ